MLFKDRPNDPMMSVALRIPNRYIPSRSPVGFMGNGLHGGFFAAVGIAL
jgi:hypothetical protein